MLIIVSAPSGAGKSTLCKELVKRHPEIKLSVSYTTRPARTGEKNGRDYFFINEKEFRKKIEKDEFLEWAIVHGARYGTEKKFVQENLAKNRNTLLEIDVQGAMKIRSIYPEAVLIFVLPPNSTTLKERLLLRNRDNLGEIEKRLKQVKRELTYFRKYDYWVINDKIGEAVERLKTIINAERFKISRWNKTGLNRNIKLKSLNGRI